MQSKFRSLLNLKNVLSIAFISGFLFLGTQVLASDNVLQAVEIDGRNDSYNIILRSDDKAEVQKTVQAPNKMILTLNGIRASKTINTIYNNTANVDSVVVEPTSDESVKISIQADNVENSIINFDTLKTPLASNGNVSQNQPSKEIVLSGPVNSYQPVYNQQMPQEESSFTFSPILSKIKNLAGQNKATTLTGLGMMLIFLVLCIKTIKGNDNDMKIGLSQSLRANEEDYTNDMQQVGGLNLNNLSSARSFNPLNPSKIQPQAPAIAGYGLKAYGASNRSPYTSSEITTRRPVMNTKMRAESNPNLALQQAVKALSQKRNKPLTSKKTFTSPVSTKIPRSNKTNSNIDSMKFLESMTKIYEKNGRADLAQGLKNNMKKAKVNLG